MYKRRLVQLVEQLSAQGFDILALVPGPNLFYLTGLSFHVSERPIVAMFPVDEDPIIVLPELEAAKVGQSPVRLDVFPYTDENGYTMAFQRACAALELAECLVGVEELRMRLLEARLLERYAPGCQFRAAEGVMAELRMRKDEQEVAQMRRAIAITEAALWTTMHQVEAGMTEREVATALRLEFLRAGGEGISFAPIVAAGPNSASPHATPSDRPIQSGEPIVVDCGASVGGYTADITRTFSVGELDRELAHVYGVVQVANRAGRMAVRPGVPAEAVDGAARAVIEQAGYGEYFFHRTGHGLGLEVHEPPYIIAGNEQLLEPGMTFTVEPGIYLPERGGVRIEDDVMVTPDGGESLTVFQRDLLPL
jgi:Xaa-Pro dipeptidase